MSKVHTSPLTGKPIKVTVVGDGTVGKTSLLIAHTTGVFPTEYEPTVFDNYTHDQTVDGTTYCLTLWDTAGQEEYEKLRPLSYPSTSVFLLCFSLNSLSSLENVTRKWLPELRSNCPRTPVILVGTKKDIRDLSAVSPKEGRRIARREGLAAYLECSAKEMDGLTEVYDAAARASVGLLKGKTRPCCIL